MGRFATIVVLFAALAIGCAQVQPDIPPDDPTWPEHECPVDSGITAEKRLSDIIEWATADQMNVVVRLATSCRDDHSAGQNHQGPATAPLAAVHQAWKHAELAHKATDPQVKLKEWRACKSELTHDP